MVSKVTDSELLEIFKELEIANNNQLIKAWQIKDVLATKGINLDESTIRGRFISMGKPLSGAVKPTTEPKVVKPAEKPKEIKNPYGTFTIPDELKPFIPKAEEFDNYVERDVDKRLAVHYGLRKYPITQGKQGTGKTMGHAYFAFKSGLPFFLFSGHEEFRLQKYFGDKTIVNGTIEFKESLMVKAIQNPSVILFDEINAIPNNQTFDFHALTQNRELFIKDANNGNGKLYKLHPDCHIGFAQNPKSAKYIGGVIKPSNFLGRCTYVTYPDFTKKELMQATTTKFKDIDKDTLSKFTIFYLAITEAIDKSKLPVDVSIRQLNNIIDLYRAGLPLKEAIEDGLSNILDSISQPTAKESFFKIAQAVWKELI